MNISYHITESFEELDAAAPGVLEELSVLIANVKEGSASASEGSLRLFFSHGGLLVVALREGRHVGMASLVRSVKLNGVTGRVEHVSVLSEFAGNGMGARLMDLLVKQAKVEGLRYLDLTSEPSRNAANSLYRKLGFRKRETNVYRLDL